MEDVNYTLHIVLALISLVTIAVINYYAWKSSVRNDNKTYYLMCLNKRNKKLQVKKEK